VNAQDAKAESFDVFLCHNSEDKPAVREIARQLAENNIKPWLDEADIRAGGFWHTAIGQQIETVKAAAVFIGQHGVGPWQNREIIALLNQFDRRGCPVIPVILASAPDDPVLPWSLVGLHCVDFRAAHSYPLKRLIWGITGERPKELSHIPASEKPATMRDAVRGRILRPSGDDQIAKKRLYPPLAQPPDPKQAAQLEILRGRVMEYWVEGVLKHSLHHEVLIALGKRSIDQAVDAPWKYTVEVPDATGWARLDTRDVSAIYDATGLLLILGEPGSGKTTTLLDLARTLLERARADLKERVPIVLNLSSWKEKQPLAEWIVGELLDKYRVPGKIARFWLEHDYLLPLLDGLDEVETRMQPDCVTTINAFIERSNPSGLVVCCRLLEYQWLPERLKLNGAICLQPLSPEEVSKYLERGGPKLAAFREAVNSDPVLQELAQTPLMLSIMSLAFQGVGGSELAKQKGDSPEERRKQIFGLYVEQMFQRKGETALTFPKEKTIGWLSWLARKMREHSESIFLVERLQPSWLGTRVQRGIYGTVVALSLGLIFAPAFELTSALNPELASEMPPWLTFGLAILVGIALGCWSKSPLRNGIMSGSIIGLISGPMVLPSPNIEQSRSITEELVQTLSFRLVFGMFLGLIGGLIGGLGVGSLNHVTLVETISWEWNQFWKKTISGLIGGLRIGLIGGLSIALMVGLNCGLSVWLGEGLSFDLLGALAFGFIVGLGVFICGLIFGFFFGLVTGLIGLFNDRPKVGKASPNQGINLSRKNALTVSLVSWLIYGLANGLFNGLVHGLSFGLNGKLEGGLWLIRMLSSAFVGGLPIGLVVGLNRGGSAVIKHYALRLILLRQGYTPLNLLKFLDHCTKLILLKKVGGGYIFIHRMLLDYFADMTP
jgi:hypothetical protein